jgi:hypothetical protein
MIATIDCIRKWIKMANFIQGRKMMKIDGTLVLTRLADEVFFQYRLNRA